MNGFRSTLQRIRDIQKLLDEKVYVGEQDQLPRWRRIVHFWVLVFRSFEKNRGPVRAGSLAYTTILSLVPMLAVAISISTGLLQNNDANVVDYLMEKFVTTVAPQLNLTTEEEWAGTANREAVVQNIKDYINAINSGTLGLTAGFVLVFIAVTVLSTVENTFNDIWGVSRGRTWTARIVQYWAAITLAPIFIFTAVGLTSTAQIASTAAEQGKKSSAAAAEAGAGTNAPTNEMLSGVGAVAGGADMNASANVTPNGAAAEEGSSAGTNAPISENPSGVAAAESAAEPEVSTVTENKEFITPKGDVAVAPETREQEPNVFQRIVNFIKQAGREDATLAEQIVARGVGTIIPFLVLSVFLTLFYRLMPNTKVRWDAALVGRAVGGGLLQLNNLFSVIYVSRVVSYSKIYGSIGAVPIFLLGLYFSWIIILLGAQVAYAYQNRQAYVQERQAESINQRGREFVALRLMASIAQAFYLGEKPRTRLEMSETLGVPSQLAVEVLCTLVAGKLLVEVNGEETGYTPARPIDRITLEDILAALRTGQGSELSTADDPARTVLREQYDRVVLAEMHAAGSVTLHDLLTRMASLASPKQTKAKEAPAPSVVPA